MVPTRNINEEIKFRKVKLFYFWDEEAKKAKKKVKEQIK